MNYVLVTTEYRGVFFGKLIEDNSPTNVLLSEARNAIHWSAKTKGFLGLAANGPQEGCRIGPAVPTLRLYNITSISECTDEAVKRWEAEPWK